MSSINEQLQGKRSDCKLCTWQKSPPNVTKVGCDASMSVDDAFDSIAIVCKDIEGLIVDGGNIVLPMGSIDLTEAFAIREACVLVCNNSS